jgi:thioredoxin-dependent peroxiredoxin
MATTALGGNPINTVGDLPAVGAPAPSFELVGADFSAITLPEGQRAVLNIFPSIDTAVCATSVRKFNEQARFCGAEGIENVKTGSTFRSSFGEDYGVKMTDGKLAGLLARSVVVVDADGTVLHSELVPEIANEPDYDAAVKALS